MSENHDVVKVRSKRYSFLLLLKLVLAAWIITWIMNSGSYLTVYMNHAMAKGIGLAVDAVELCQNYWNSLPAGG